jgi:hypothetical protein
MGIPLLRVAMEKFKFGKFPTDEILDFGFWILDTVPTAGCANDFAMPLARLTPTVQVLDFGLKSPTLLQPQV